VGVAELPALVRDNTHRSILPVSTTGGPKMSKLINNAFLVTAMVALLVNQVSGSVQVVSANARQAEISANAIDLRQDGSIQISGDLVEGGKVYLSIPVKNYGNTASPAIHPYTEGYTSQGALWRADGAQPSSAVIQPGQRVVFQVEHDLWYGHVGTWSTYGVYVWNDSVGDYLSPLASNGYNQARSFEVTDTPLQSLDIRYLDDSNRAIDIDYAEVSALADGSLSADIIVTNKLNVPYMMCIWTVGDVSDPDGKLEKFEAVSQSEMLPLLPKTTLTFEDVHFQRGSYIEFHFPMFGNDDQDRNFIYGLHGIQILSIVAFGFIPTGDSFKTYEELVSGGLGIFAEAINNVDMQFFIFGEKLGQGDIAGALDALADILSFYADEVAKAFNALFKTSISAKLIEKLSLISVLWSGGKYLRDLARAPGFAQVKVVPSSRPPDGLSLDQEATVRSEEGGATVIASSSEQGIGWSQVQIVDGDTSSGWASGSELPVGEWIIVQLANNAPVRIESIHINPGPTNGDHEGAALKDFHVDVSLDGYNFTTVLSGDFASSELAKTKSFAISPITAAYIRLVADSNQSNNAVPYVNIAEISVTGTAYSPADGFEPDSESDFAHLINSNGVTQLHNFHYPGDVDWHRLQAVEGATYIIGIEALGSNVRTLIQILDSDELTTLYSSTFGSSQSFDWQAPATADYFVSISHQDNQVYGPDTAYVFSTLQVRSRVFLPIISSSGR
jgi:hypothetical protein